MALLTITELEKISFTVIDGQAVMVPQLPGVAEQGVAIGAGSVPSAAFDKRTRFVMINCDIACCLAVSTGGSDPTALNNRHRMGADETRFIGVTPGGKIAVIAY